MSALVTSPSDAATSHARESPPKYGWRNTLYTGLSLAALTVGTFGVQMASREIESELDSSLPIVPVTEVLRQAQNQIDSGAHVVREIEVRDVQGLATRVALGSLRITGFVAHEGKVIDGATSNIMKVGTWKFSGDESFSPLNTATLTVRGAELRRIAQAPGISVQGPRQIEIIPISVFKGENGGLTIFSMDVVAALD
jgi:hypothetical protein